MSTPPTSRAVLWLDRRRSSARCQAGFTLIELLLVVTIMALMLSLTAGVSQGVVNSMNFRQAIQNVKTQLDTARQTAMTKNRPVIVRITEERDDLGALSWRGVQIGMVEAVVDPSATGYQRPLPGSYEPEFKAASSPERLPSGFVFHPSDAYSTLLGEHPSVASGTVAGPDGGLRKYQEFVFLPDGRCALPAGQSWTLTVVRERDVTASADDLPADFATIQIDSRTARARVYRR
ncbi:Verru_Chthon cassette protein D [Verrucomicrobium sp. BvORR034]|uniref:Verru_Chthon cassette protein D n=1 Tax=Verrucomicrobium sp. BvORR034 TaxID=1396418 RepID=UPI0009E0088A|nr:Verru_Chthon cassette protein D [Verrucomicrobium sp. BvORR034]